MMIGLIMGISLMHYLTSTNHMSTWAMSVQLVIFVCFSFVIRNFFIGVHCVFYAIGYPFVIPVWVVGLCFYSLVADFSLLGSLILGLF